jgi:hypothetical protein
VVLVVDPQPVFLAVAGIAGGLALLGRGFVGYRRAGQIAGTSTSTVTSLAAGEVRVSGVVEASELTLVSPLQSASCVYYRSSVHEGNGRSNRKVVDEERAVGFRLRDATGAVRIFPNGARFDVPACFSESTGAFGDEPAGLLLRTGPAIAEAHPDRASQIAALLTVHQVAGTAELGGLGVLSGTRGASVQYHESRIEPGQLVTVIGQALPFDQLPDPASADQAGSDDPLAPGDPEIAADLAAAREAGVLATDAKTAWGNAAIPGFGVGHPVSQPTLDPAAHRLPLATAEQAKAASRTFEIPPNELVLAASPDVPLTIALGGPAEATGRAEGVFLVGLLGAVLAIASAVALGFILQVGLP